MDPVLAIRDGGANSAPSSRFTSRLGEAEARRPTATAINRPDGGWCNAGEKSSDIVSTYHVMRALVLLKEKPKDLKKLREFIDSHRNRDSGYATKPGDKSSMSGVYYAIVIGKWLDEMEARK